MQNQAIYERCSCSDETSKYGNFIEKNAIYLTGQGRREGVGVGNFFIGEGCGYIVEALQIFSNFFYALQRRYSVFCPNFFEKMLYPKTTPKTRSAITPVLFDRFPNFKNRFVGNFTGY